MMKCVLTKQNNHCCLCLTQSTGNLGNSILPACLLVAWNLLELNEANQEINAPSLLLLLGMHAEKKKGKQVYHKHQHQQTTANRTIQIVSHNGGADERSVGRLDCCRRGFLWILPYLLDAV